jgi:hypothetical protein
VLDDSANTGGYLICTYSDLDRSPVVYDTWVENYIDVIRAFEDAGWAIEWQG